MSAQQIFIDLVLPGAVAIQRKYGLPAVTMVAQAALETGWGSGKIFLATLNIFSIKGVGPAGSVWFNDTWEVVNGDDEYVKAEFRKYNSPEESFDDYAVLITGFVRYQKASAVKNDAYAYARALQECGYATDPNYADKMINIIESYCLELQVGNYMMSHPIQPTEPQTVEEIPEWKHDGVQYLAGLGLIDPSYGWDEKLNEPMPVWAAMNLFARVFRHIDSLKVETKIVKGDVK